MFPFSLKKLQDQAEGRFSQVIPGTGAITVIPSGKKGTGNNPVRHLLELHVHLQGTVVGHKTGDGHKTEGVLVSFISGFFLALELFPSFLNLRDRRVE